MIPNLAYDYVRDIPWDQNPAFAFSDDAEAYLKAFESVVQRLPDEKERISFSSDVWDFNPYFEDSNTKHHRFCFDTAPFELRNYLKFFVLHKAMGKVKLSTTYVRMTNAVSIINHVMEDTTHNSLCLITTEDLCNEIRRRNTSPSTTHNNYEAVYQFFYFLINNYRLELPVDVEELKRLGVAEKELSKKEDTKLADIPEEYFNAILEKAVSVMRDSTFAYNERATACAIVMLSQLGLRIGDLLGLTTDRLFCKTLPKSGWTVYYIHYKSHKPSKPHDELLEFDIFSNSLCTEAFQTLNSIRKCCEFSNEPYLYVLDSVYHSRDVYPLPNHRFRQEFRRFLQKNLLKEASMDWHGIQKRIVTIGSGRIKKRFRLSIPDTRQFRVHLCTVLYNKGIPLVYIQKYMGHLSEYMLGYYVRPKDTYQENIAYSEKVIREIAGDDLTPIGLMGSDLRENIKLFISERKLNVKTDTSQIMEALGNKLVIRGKTGGVCIKTSLMPCARDSRTNEILCAYNLCPNLFHFYYMADISYLDFQTLQSTYNENHSAGHTKAAQKELQKIKDLLRRKLIPELDELDREISLNGRDHILIRNPSLSTIIDNEPSIREEIELWMQKH